MTENNIAYYMAEAGIDLEKAWQLVSGTLNPEARLACRPETLSKDSKCDAQLRRIGFMLDTAGGVLYRQGKFREAEPYLLSAYAINPHAETEVHLSAALLKLGRLDESVKYYASARSRADFARVDSAEVRRELVKASGDAEFESRLAKLQPPAASRRTLAHVIALGDGDGKLLEARPSDGETPDSLVGEAKALRLSPIAWPEHSIRSTRTLEFQMEGEKWALSQSFVVPAADPTAGR